MDIKGITDFLTRQFPDEESAIKYFAQKRWGNSCFCPQCGSGNIYISKNLLTKQPYKCGVCALRFTVKKDTIMEGSPVSVRIWLLAMYILGTSKKSISSLLLAKWLGVQQKTAWFMAHRIRETCNIQQEKLKGTIEMNETFIGGKESNKHENKRLKQGRGTVGKVAVMGAISREKKQAVAYPVSSVNHDTVTSFRNNHIDANSDIIAANVLHMISHTQLRVNHSKKQYVDGIIHTNSIESFWATIKARLYWYISLLEQETFTPIY